MTWIMIFILWFSLSLFAASIANKKGRSGNAFFFLAFFLSPVVGIIAALAADSSPEGIERNELLKGLSRKCPFCAELVKKDAAICKHCGKDLPELVTPTLQNWKGGKII